MRTPAVGRSALLTTAVGRLGWRTRKLHSRHKRHRQRHRPNNPRYLKPRSLRVLHGNGHGSRSSPPAHPPLRPHPQARTDRYHHHHHHHKNKNKNTCNDNNTSTDTAASAQTASSPPSRAPSPTAPRAARAPSTTRPRRAPTPGPATGSTPARRCSSTP